MAYTKYEPIEFENGKLVSPAKVDPETGVITPAVYSCDKPIGATTLNHIESGIVNLEEYATNLVEDSLDSNSTTNAPSIRAVNQLVAYSTEEVLVGTWTDGKPIYRKVVSCGVMPNTDIKSIPHNIDNIDFITNYYGITYRDTDGVSFKLPYSAFPTENGIAVYVNKETIVITTTSDRSTITQSYLIIEYTKTTD